MLECPPGCVGLGGSGNPTEAPTDSPQCPVNSFLRENFFAGVPKLETLRLDLGAASGDYAAAQVAGAPGGLRSLSVEGGTGTGARSRRSEPSRGTGAAETPAGPETPRPPLLTNLPGSFRDLTALRRLQISGCKNLESLNFWPTWKNLEVLQVSECGKLSSPGGALGPYPKLTNLHLGCSMAAPGAS